ncbi:hypothetical protein JHW43_007833 [Diplocarpon mali]|nr:hypothetical protein JHW43_007833 [Diplocarpon mali]
MRRPFVGATRLQSIADTQQRHVACVQTENRVLIATTFPAFLPLIEPEDPRFYRQPHECASFLGCDPRRDTYTRSTRQKLRAVQMGWDSANTPLSIQSPGIIWRMGVNAASWPMSTKSVSSSRKGTVSKGEKEALRRGLVHAPIAEVPGLWIRLNLGYSRDAALGLGMFNQNIEVLIDVQSGAVILNLLKHGMAEDHGIRRDTSNARYGLPYLVKMEAGLVAMVIDHGFPDYAINFGSWPLSKEAAPRSAVGVYSYSARIAQACLAFAGRSFCARTWLTWENLIGAASSTEDSTPCKSSYTQTSSRSWVPRFMCDQALRTPPISQYFWIFEVQPCRAMRTPDSRMPFWLCSGFYNHSTLEPVAQVFDCLRSASLTVLKLTLAKSKRPQSAEPCLEIPHP